MLFVSGRLLSNNYPKYYLHNFIVSDSNGVSSIVSVLSLRSSKNSYAENERMVQGLKMFRTHEVPEIMWTHCLSDLRDSVNMKHRCLRGFMWFSNWEVYCHLRREVRKLCKLSDRSQTPSYELWRSSLDSWAQVHSPQSRILLLEISEQGLLIWCMKHVLWSFLIMKNDSWIRKRLTFFFQWN